MQSDIQKNELQQVLLMCNVHPKSLVEFLEESIEAQRKVQEVANDVRLDFRVIQAELFLAAIRS